ncbi:aldo/keto reductase [Bacillus massilinigeriensis]|uniref:aldo/keto reductase n=1 Tax=Bacillus massilionigeriensis TaxID=1805475 RepID=UPI00096B5F42|nr:aldo/keto reductase [Bacillus massilionigeriensis]
MKHLHDTTALHNGVKMPWLGLGVYKVKEGDEVYNSVSAALKAGYRSIDTAALYGNEEGVGRAVKDSDVLREEIFITTKIWNTDQGYDKTLEAFETSLRKLDLSYLDLLLIHWPVKEKYKDTWKAFEKLYQDGLVRAIGVSNFQIHHLEDLLSISEVKPMVNQVELHPFLTQVELRKFCKSQDIKVEAWSPLGRGHLLNHEVITKIAEKYNKTSAQVILRWDLQKEIITIPKSTKEHRIIENANIYDFELSAEDIKRIDALNQDKRFGQHPDHFHFDF